MATVKLVRHFTLTVGQLNVALRHNESEGKNGFCLLLGPGVLKL
jgi:hypothetical protein